MNQKFPVGYSTYLEENYSSPLHEYWYCLINKNDKGGKGGKGGKIEHITSFLIAHIFAWSTIDILVEDHKDLIKELNKMLEE